MTVGGNQLNTLQTLDSAGYIRSIDPTDILQVGSEMEFQADVKIGGNLTVEGTVTRLKQEIVSTFDNHILVNDGYTSLTAQTGGLVVVNHGTATTDTVDTGGFTAGVPATSNPTIATVGAATFALGDLILVTGADDEANNGLFEVLSHSANLLTVRGIGTTARVEDFTQNQFTADATVAGAITKVDISVLRADTAGVWETGTGTTTPISFTNLGTGAGNTLTQAYQAGNTLTTDAGNGDLIVSGTETMQVTATGGLNLDAPFDFDSTSFDVQMTGTNGFSIDGTAASNVSVTAGNLALSTITSGDVDILSAGDVDVDGVGIQLDATAAFSIDGAAASNVSATAANLTISTITSGVLGISAAGLLDIDAAASMDVDITGTLDMLATGAFSIDGTGASNVSATSGNLTISTITTGDLILAAAADVDVDGVNVRIDASSAFSIDGAAASNLSTTGADLTISTVTSGVLALVAAGLLDVDAAAGMDVDVTGAFDMLSTGAFSIDGTGASNVSATSGNLTISTLTTGSLLLTSAGDSTYTIPDASVTALTITDGAQDMMVFDTTSGEERVSVPRFLDLSAPEGGAGTTQLNAGAVLVSGNLVFIAADGEVELADANAGNLRNGNVFGVSRDGETAGNPARIYTMDGNVVPVLFAAAPAAADRGKWVYLSETAGQATLTAPTGNDRVVTRLGTLATGDGADTTPLVALRMRVVSVGPQVTVP